MPTDTVPILLGGGSAVSAIITVLSIAATACAVQYVWKQIRFKGEFRLNIIVRWVLKQMHEERIRKLTAMPTDDLKSFWDRYDGCNAPDGHEGEDIHLALNMKGAGDYCAV